MTTTTTELVYYEDPADITERVAIGGFLAGYTGNTRTSYTTDLRIFADWCHHNHLTLLAVRRVHLELFARWMEAEGRMRFDGSPPAVDAGQLLPLLRRRGRRGPRPFVQRAPTQGRPRVPHTRVGPQRASAPCSSRPASARRVPSRVGHAVGDERVAHLRSAQRRRRGSRHRTRPPHPANRAQGRQAGHRPLSPRTSRALDLYLGERTGGPIFLTHDGRRMDRSAADRTVKRLARRAGISKQISPHRLR